MQKVQFYLSFQSVFLQFISSYYYSSNVYSPSPRTVCYTLWRYCGLLFFSYHSMVEVENKIKIIMDKIHSPILIVPGISYRMEGGAMILAEIGEFSRFDSPDKISALYSLQCNEICLPLGWILAVYLAKKRAEGKHYNVALSPCHKETCTIDFRNGKIGTGIQ